MVDLDINGFDIVEFMEKGKELTNVIEGFASLAVAVAAIWYLSRWLARGAGRSQWELEDLERAIAVVDHHHGFSPALGLASFRSRQRWLWSQREVTRLVLWYGR